MDIFDKCQRFYAEAAFAQELGYPANPRMAEALGLYPFFIPLDASEGTEAIIDGRRFVMAGSNNYLGLTTHPEVEEAVESAVRQYGSSCTGSRFLNGTLHLHCELERELAAFLNKEAALVFSTGYQTSLGALSALGGRGDTLVLDKEVHASILDGAWMARECGQATIRFFRHSDVRSLEQILASCPRDSAKLVVVDGVFSMSGDIAPLPDILSVCQKQRARVMVDDAHGIGVLGEGRGTAHHFGCAADVDLIMGTFSKSLASTGGFVAGRRDVVNWIRHFARSFIFSASLAPANTAAALAALRIVVKEPHRVDRVNANGETMRRELKAMGYDIGRSQTPIVPIIVGDQFRTMQMWSRLYKRGVYVNVALPPAVPAHKSLLRTSYMATHTDEHLQRIVACFEDLRAHIPSFMGYGREESHS